MSCYKKKKMLKLPRLLNDGCHGLMNIVIMMGWSAARSKMKNGIYLKLPEMTKTLANRPRSGLLSSRFGFPNNQAWAGYTKDLPSYKLI